MAGVNADTLMEIRQRYLLSGSKILNFTSLIACLLTCFSVTIPSNGNLVSTPFLQNIAGNQITPHIRLLLRHPIMEMEEIRMPRLLVGHTIVLITMNLLLYGKEMRHPLPYILMRLQ